MKAKILVTAILALASSEAAMAQSPDYMVQDCKLSSQQFYQDYKARSEAKYEGQRTDGTHAVNGTIYLENRSAYFSCSYNSAGNKLVEFFAEKKSWPNFVRGGGSPYKAGSSAGSGSKPSISTERVRFPAGTSSFEFPAQLPPGMTVRYQIGAKKNQFLVVRISPTSAPLKYRILNPNGSALVDELSVETPYRGQLWQSGDHIVEVVNRTGSTVPFQIYFGIE
jgi:hypothetical protein